MNRSIFATALAGVFLVCSVPVAAAHDGDEGRYDDDRGRGWGRNRNRNRDNLRGYGTYRNDTYRNDGRYGGGYGGNGDITRYPGSYGNGASGSRVIDRTMADLQRTGSRNRLDGHEQNHISRAMNDLRVLRSRFDDGRLRSAIENLEHLVNADQVHPNDRRTLARDMNDLRSLHNNSGGYRY